jgi:hypothetical protein
MMTLAFLLALSLHIFPVEEEKVEVSDLYFKIEELDKEEKIKNYKDLESDTYPELIKK